MFPILLQEYICEVALLGLDTARSVPSCPTGMNPFQQEKADRDNKKTGWREKPEAPLFTDPDITEPVDHLQESEGKVMEFKDSKWQY